MDDGQVHDADEKDIKAMAKALGCGEEMVEVSLAGLLVQWCQIGFCGSPTVLMIYWSTFAAEHGKRIGWAPKHDSEHMLRAMDAEVELILQHI